MATVKTIVNNVDSNSKASMLGGFIKNCGIATLDVDVGQTFKWVGAGSSGGDIIVLGVDGNPIYFPAVPAGAIRPVLGTTILSAATVSGSAVTTTATPVVWYGGE